jgi:hypothetical protein
MSVLRKSNSKLSARRQINIKSVRDGVLALPGNEYRLVLEASSINFELKSEAEQDALIETYQSFLNSLGSALQIIIRAKELDMDKYLGEFEARMQGETEDIYRTQIASYSEFVAKLVTSNKILARRFYIVLPFAARDTNDFDLIKEHLLLNADIVSKGLGRLGMRTRQLSSLEVLDLFYSFYNPAQAKAQPITDQTLQLLKESYL